MAKRNYVEHSFFCVRCGNRGIPISRNVGHQHERFHRKKLYCLTCKTDVNHIECKDAGDIYDFKTAFERGDFRQEAENPVPDGGLSCFG